MTRLGSRVLIDAIRRRTEADGGTATVIARGDADGGAIILLAVERGGRQRLFERMPIATGERHWRPVGPDDDDEAATRAYLQRRRQVDPDLWLLEVANLADPLAAIAGMTGES